MEYFAKRVKNFKRSFTREILELTSKKEIISFAGGLPDSSLFPRKIIENEVYSLLKNCDNSLFQYSSSKGVEELREELSKRYFGKKDEILLTTGSQQALDIICKAFITPKDKIVIQNPTYLAAINLFEMYEANLIGVKISNDNLDIKRLYKIFKEERPKLFYIIPQFQNPTGQCWSKDSKLKVAKLAKKFGTLIVEDDPYGELRYDGKKESDLAKILPKQTISISTFSKVLSPDFRIGWIRSDKKFMDTFQTIKEYSDLQSSKFFQLITANLIKNGGLAKHIDLLKREYRTKRDNMAKSLDGIFGDIVDYEVPKGGMFFWVRFKENIDTMKLFKYAIKESVAFVPGEVFFLKDKKTSYMRLNFTNIKIDDIWTGLERLKKAYDTFIFF